MYIFFIFYLFIFLFNDFWLSLSQIRPGPKSSNLISEFDAGRQIMGEGTWSRATPWPTYL